MRENRRKVYSILLLVATVMLASMGTYAFFTSNVDNSKNQTATLKTGTMTLVFDDNDNGVNAKLNPNEQVTKKFKVTNTGTLEASLSINWEQLVNTYLNGSLTYDLRYCEEEHGTYKDIITNVNVPVTDTPISQAIESELSVPSGDTYYYELVITLNDLKDVNQTDDYEAYLNTKFSASDPRRYKFYKLLINPNGGEWNGFTTTQSYNLKNKESFTVPNPTKTGATFEGWKLEGLSSTLDGTTFTMGIADATLTAEWSEEKYSISINLDNGVYSGTLPTEIGYMDSFELSIPTKEGYTFTHWSSEDGLIEGNTFTLTTNKSPVIKANWSVNKYKYIVYHYKQNVNNDEYTVSEADTEEGEADYNSTVSPEVKTFTGFKSPERKSLTIRHETVTPPVLNKIDYNYARNKHTLTINSNGGTYSGNTSQQLKYEQTITLDVPTKTGYTFSNWTNSSGSMDVNTFTMGDSDATVSANYTPNKYAVTFNANGGTTSTASMEVTYDGVYGTLPTPEYTGYKFLGWFTDATAGVQVTEDTIYNKVGNVTLYAHWKKETDNIMTDERSMLLWSKKANIKQVIFEDSINPIDGATLSYDISKKSGDKTVMAYLVPVTGNSSQYIAHIQADGKIKGNGSRLFDGFTNLESIDGLENFDTSMMTSMNSMFDGCSKLTSLDLSNFDTSNVDFMGWMFINCSSLTSLDLSSFDTSKVTSMHQMFSGCKSLKTLNVSSFNTSNVTDMVSMFFGCQNLTSLNLSNFDTSNVNDMNSMFEYCINLKSLNVSSFDTSNVTKMNSMFENCQNLTSLDVSSFDTSNVTDMNSMFSGCQNLTSLNLSNFNTSNVTNMKSMFSKCQKLSTTLTIRGTKCTTYSDMFYNAATYSATITVNYASGTSSLVNYMIATKSSNSNVVKGSFVS